MKKILAVLAVAIVLVASVSIGLYVLTDSDSSEERFTIHFDTSGGDAADPISVTYGNKIGALPLSYYPESHLEGWYHGDVKFTGDTVYNEKEDITLKARWAANTVISMIDSNEFSFKSKMWETASLNTSQDVPSNISEEIKTFSGKPSLSFFKVSVSGEGIVDGQEVELGIPLTNATSGDNIDVWVRLSDGSITKVTGTVDGDERLQITVPSVDFVIGVDSSDIRIVPESVALNRTNVSMGLGNTVILEATVLPSDAVNKDVVWSTSDPSVASVLDGTVRALKTGSAVITAKTAEGNKVAQCNVTVTQSASAYLGTLYLDVADGNGEDVLYGQGTTIRTIIESALSTKDHTIQYRSNNSILSVDNKQAVGETAWVLWKWTPSGWEAVPNVTWNTEIFEGVCFAITLSDATTGPSGTDYSKPEDPVFTAHFFIQFKEDYNANSLVNSVYTEAERREGFWIVGKGRDPLAALNDAVYAFMFTNPSYTEAERDQILLYNDDPGNVSYGWLGTFCGLNDVMVEENNETLWRYWSQYTWDSGTGDWEYNQLTIGKVDLSKYAYYSLVRQTTSENDLGSGLTVTPMDCDVSYDMGVRRD